MNRKTQNLGKSLASEKVRQLPLMDPVVVSPDTALSTVFKRMKTAKSGCALVQQDEALIGIFTERDVLTRVIEAELPSDTPIKQVMTAHPKTLPFDSTIAEAVRMMNEGGYRNIPLTSDDPSAKAGVIKLLSARDLVSYFGSNFPEEVYNLPPDPNQIQTAREGA